MTACECWACPDPAAYLIDLIVSGDNDDQTVTSAICAHHTAEFRSHWNTADLVTGVRSLPRGAA